MALSITKDCTVERVGASISSSSKTFARVAKKSGNWSGKLGYLLEVKVAPIEHLRDESNSQRTAQHYLARNTHIAFARTSEYNELT